MSHKLSLLPLLAILLFASCAKSDDNAEQISGPSAEVIDRFMHSRKDAADTFYFSVSGEDIVSFAKGNLQYLPKADSFRFAPHQYDYVGADNRLASATDECWMDLFGWGNTGYDPDKMPYQTSTDTLYAVDRTTLAGSHYDWGVHCSIGGTAADVWRTLTRSEWQYLFLRRAHARERYATATVNDVAGLIILPDNWTLPDGAAFASGTGAYTANVYTAEQWAIMESHGAIFLPAAGQRSGTTVTMVGEGGYYWSASSEPFPCTIALDTTGQHNFPCALHFFAGTVDEGYYDYFYKGFCVRLVK